MRIQAPNARVAALLAERLQHLDAVVIEESHGGPAEVSLPASGRAIEVSSVLRATQRWLAQQRLPGTHVHLDGRSFYLAAT
jgi:hypothetical protein